MGCSLLRLFYFPSYLSILLFIRCKGKHFTHWVNMKQNLSNTNVTFSLSVFQLPLSATFFFHTNGLPGEANTTIANFRALFLLYYGITITYVVLILHGPCI